MKQKTKIMAVVSVLLICTFLAGISFAIVINQVAPQYIGFWSVQENNTNLQILNVQNQIQSPIKLKTTVRISNPSGISISFNATVSFYGSETELTTYIISDTLNTGQTKNYVNTNIFNIVIWDSTSIHIDATS